MALPTLDGRTHKPVAGVVMTLRVDLLDCLYAAIDSDDNDTKIDAEAQLSGMLAGRVQPRVAARFVEVMLTDEPGVKEVLSILLPLNGEHRPLGVAYEVYIAGGSAHDGYRHVAPNSRSPLYRLALDALDTL